MPSEPNSPRDDLVVFDLDLPHGRCVGVEVREAAHAGHVATSPPEELDMAKAFGPSRQASFHAGRRALRLALADLGVAGGAPLLPDERGAPQVPDGTLGSISHKRTRAVGLAARRSSGLSRLSHTGAPAPLLVEEIGVDIEEIRPLRFDISPRVLTPAERTQRAQQPVPLRDQFVLERFSLKESFFKAVNHLVGPRISFQAVEVVAIGRDGRAELRAPWLTDRGLQLQGWLGYPESGFILTSVRLSSSGVTTPSRP